MKDIVNKTFYSYSGGVMPQMKAEFGAKKKNALIVLKWPVLYTIIYHLRLKTIKVYCNLCIFATCFLNKV